MNNRAENLIHDLAGQGIRLAPNGDKLHVEAPPGMLTADLRQKLTARKPLRDLMPTKTGAAKTRTKPNISENQEKPTSATKHSKSKRRVEMFVNEYLVDLNGRKAAVRAGYSAQSARQTASELLATLPVQEAVAKAMEARSARTRITVDKVLERWWAIATADPNELIELRRTCCRYCYGKGHCYQWTPRELAEALAQFERDKMFAEAKGVTFSATFDAAGGVGYDQRQDPISACPECHEEDALVAREEETTRCLTGTRGHTMHARAIDVHDELLVACATTTRALENQPGAIATEIRLGVLSAIGELAEIAQVPLAGFRGNSGHHAGLTVRARHRARRNDACQHESNKSAHGHNVKRAPRGGYARRCWF